MVSSLPVRQGAAVAFASTIAAAAAFSSLAPRGGVVLLLGVAAAAAWLLYPTFSKGWARIIKRPVVLSGVLLIAYMALSVGWALDPGAAASKVAGLAVVALCVVACFAALRRLDPPSLRLAGHAFLAGAAFGIGFVMIEFASGQAITRALFNLLPILRPPGEKDLFVKAGHVYAIGDYELNRNIAVLVLLLWPLVMMLMHQSALRGGAIWAAAAIGLVAIMAFASEHETSMIAVCLSAFVALAARYSAKAVGVLLMALWCLAFVAIIPVSHYAYETAQLHRSSFLPTTARARIIIWGFTANKVAENPLAGIGVRSTRVLDATLVPNAEQEEGDVFAKRPGRHAHNLFLQSWLELGAIGAALVMAFGLAILVRIRNLAGNLQPHSYALFTVFLVIAALAWGMWQTWLLAVYALSAFYLALGARLAATKK